MNPSPLGENHGIRTPAPDTSAADWIGARLIDWSSGDAGVPVGGIVPTGFEAYARVFHPAGIETAEGHRRNVRWDEVAASTGRIVHPLMEWEQIVTPAPGSGRSPLPYLEPNTGELPDEQLRALASILTEFTTTPGLCWFCLWDGFGGVVEAGAKVHHPSRDYFLSSGPIEAVTSFRYGMSVHPPNIWWPDDRAWCVASEIDLLATYVGGRAACVEQLLSSPELEALPISVDGRVDADADQVNRD